LIDMGPLLMGILAAVLGFMLFFFYMLLGRSFLRVFTELVLAVGLAYLFMVLGWSTFMAYLAAGLSVAMIYFIKAN